MKPDMQRVYLHVLILLFMVPTLSFGQQSQVLFGKNRIQYKTFNWQYISTYNFDVYYYEGGKDLARTAAAFAESDFQKIIDMTGFTPYSKMKLIVYNSVSDMQQSNIGLVTEIVIGGQTNFVKSKIEVAFKGNQNEFRKDIRYSISGMIINIMLYGGSLKDIVQSSYLLSLPEWYVNGAAAYISEGWSLKMDNYVRDMFRNDKFKKPSLLMGREASIAGQSIWNFIAERYGKSHIASILNLTRILRNEEASIESTLGVPYHVFIREWVAYYSGMAGEVTSSYERAGKENKIIKNNFKDKEYKNVRLSPDGHLLSYIKTYRGKYYLVIHDLETGKKNRIQNGGHRLLNQQEDENIVFTAWKSPEVFTYIEKKRNKLRLNFYDVKKGKTVRKDFNEFNQIMSYSFSEDGERMIISADKKGQSDIYLYEFKSSSFRQLTNDFYDDLNPAFIKGSNSVVFSSNRSSDTLALGPGSYHAFRNTYDIFVYPLTGKVSVLKKLTDFGVNVKPISFDKENILFLSSEKGINNVYKYNLASGVTTQVSKFLHDLDDFDANKDAGKLTFTSLDEGSEYIYCYKDFNFNNSFKPVLTKRESIIEAEKPRKIKSPSTVDTAAPEEKEHEININDYRFESDMKVGKKTESKEIEKPKAVVPKDEIRIAGPSKYQNNFGVERVNSTLMIDPLRGLGILMEANMADMMGNHRMNAGLFGLTDLKSSSVFGEYLYLKKRIDYKFRYDRYTLFAFDDSESQRYTLNKGAVTFSYPFSVSKRFSLTPYVMNTRFTNLNFNDTAFFAKDGINSYVGSKAEYVYDNTSITGMNMMEGTRCKFSIDYNVHTKNSMKNFGKFIMDLRHYQPIHRDLVFATRFSYGKFFGNSKKNFLLGGMDNWLFNSTTHHGALDPLSLGQFKDNSDLLFVEYVTSMRGFNYNTQFGPNFVLLNGELRMPIVKYIYHGVINSNFLKNLQLIGFTDVGSSWSGKSPFTTDNSTNTTIVGGGSNPFTAKVINYKNPFLIGYGFGARTLMLGYYVKFDVAWGKSGNTVNRMLYLTFGYDF